MQLILRSSREHKEKANDVDDPYTCGNLHRARNQRLPTGRVLILDLVRAARSPPCGLYLCREMLTKKEEPKLPFLFYARRTPTNGSSRSGAGRSRRAACGRTFVMPPFWPELAAGAVASEPLGVGVWADAIPVETNRAAAANRAKWTNGSGVSPAIRFQGRPA